MIYIGIDPGSTTGMAEYNPKGKDIFRLHQFKSHAEAMIFAYERIVGNKLLTFKLFIEDARLAKKRPDLAKVNTGKAQGVGYVKAYSKDWEAFCKLLGVQYELRPPSNTKSSPEYFEKLTGLKTLKTQHHLRDAGLLVYGR